MRALLKVGFFAFIPFILAACVGAFSEDPQLAAKQQWIAGCKIADSNIQTVTKLYKAGLLSESAADQMDKVVDMYDVVCTGDPPLPGATIQSAALLLLASRVCPASVPPTGVEGWQMTLITASACIAEGALLAE
jgi:hypothetical protein